MRYELDRCLIGPLDVVEGHYHRPAATQQPQQSAHSPVGPVALVGGAPRRVRRPARPTRERPRRAPTCCPGRGSRTGAGRACRGDHLERRRRRQRAVPLELRGRPSATTISRSARVPRASSSAVLPIPASPDTARTDGVPADTPSRSLHRGQLTIPTDQLARCHAPHLGDSPLLRNASRLQPRRSTLDSIRAISFVVVLQLRMVMFLYSGSEATLLSRLLVAFAASREK